MYVVRLVTMHVIL